MAVPSDALTTRTKVKTYLGISGTDFDTVIDEIITGVTAFIKSYCGVNFLSASYTEIRDTKRGRTKVFLRNLPITTLTSVEYRGGTPSTPVWSTYNTDSYLLYANAGYVYFYGPLPEVAQGLRFTYTAGYLIDWTNELTATHTLPADLSMAASELVGTILNTRKAGGITTETTEGQSISYDFKRSMSDNVKSILNGYKLYNLAQ